MAIEKISVEISSNIKDIERQLSEIDSRLRTLQDRRHQISINADKLADARKQIKEIDVELSRLRAQKAQIQVDATKSEAAKKQLEEINAKMRELGAKKATLQVDTTQLKGSDTQLRKINTEMGQLSNKKARLQVSRDDAVEAESGLGRIRSKLGELNASRTKINISSNIEKIGSSLNGMGNKILGIFNPLKSMLGQWVGIGAAVNLVNRGISMITGSLGGAVSRFDTMNNFPRVMENLGIAGEDAQAAIDELADGLKGLPTALDSATSSVQRLTSKNGDVRRSTKMFLAMNNAILAGGGSAQIQESAIEQLSQAYSKGQMDMMEWRTLQMAMPAQLTQVAKAMGITTDALGEGLRNGTIAMENFMDVMMRLNDEGVEGFASFAEQAKSATGGISTGLANMRTSIVRGWTKIISAADAILERAGLGGISQLFGTIGSAVEGAMTTIAGVIEANSGTIIEFIDRIRNFDWASLWAGFKEGITDLKDSAKALLDTFRPLLDMVKNAITNLGEGDFARGLGKLPALLIKIAVGLKVVGSAIRILGKISNFKLPGFGKKGEGGAGGGLSFNFDTGKALNQIKNLALVFGAIKIIEELAQAMKDINDKVPSNTLDLLPKLANMAIALVGMGALVAVAGKLAEHNKEAAVLGLLAIAAIGGLLMETAEAMAQINEKVPADIALVGLKLANMAIALVGMGTLVAVAGLLAQANPLAAVAGLAAVALLAGELMLVAEAMRQLDKKVPSDVKSIALKISNIGIAIGAMSVLVGVIGALIATGVGAIIAGAGLVTVLALAGALIVISEAISELDKKVPSNAGAVVNKINTIADVMRAFSEARLGSAFETFSNAYAAMNIATVSEGLTAMVRIANQLKKLSKATVPQNAVTQIRKIKTVIEEITKGNSLFDELKNFDANVVASSNIVVINGILRQMVELASSLHEFDANIGGLDAKSLVLKIIDIKSIISAIGSNSSAWENTNQFYSDAIASLDVDVITQTLEKFTILSQKLREFDNESAYLDFETISGKISNIQDVLEAISSDVGYFSGYMQLTADVVKSMDTSVLVELFDKLIAASDSIDRLMEKPEVDVGAVKTKLGNIRTVLDALTDNSGYFVSTMTMMADSAKAMDTSVLAKILDTYIYIGKSIARLRVAGGNFSVEDVKTKIGNIRAIMEELEASGNVFGTAWSTSANTWGNANDIAIANTLDTLKVIAEKIIEFSVSAASVVPERITKRIGRVKEVLEYIEKEREFFSGIGEKLSILGSEETRASLAGALDMLTETAGKIVALSGEEINVDAATGVVDAISRVVQALAPMPTINTQRKEQYSTILSVVGDLSNIAIILSQMDSTIDVEAVTGTIEDVKEIVELIDGFPESSDEMSIHALISAFKEMVDTLSTMADEMFSTGKDFGERFIQGVTDANVPNRFSDIMRQALDAINRFSDRMYSIGVSFGRQVAAGLKKGMDGLDKVVGDEISKIMPPGMSNGGSVGTSYLASGGFARPRGTDTVPAMLTPGEFVHKRSSVGLFGREFMERVNSGDIAGVFKSMVGRFGAPPNYAAGTVVNNVSHSRTSTANVTQNFIGGNPDYAMRRTSRYLGARTR